MLAELLDSLLVKAVAVVLTPALFTIVYLLGRRLYRAFSALRYVEQALAAVAREKQPDDRQFEGPGFWLKQPIVPPANYRSGLLASIPVLMIAATKGGVGKTSLAGSLAAHFAMRWTQRRQDSNAENPLRILVIDQDFQGSYTTMTVAVPQRYAQPSKANRLVSGELGGVGVQGEAEPLTQPGMRPLSIWTIPAYYDLAQAENRMLLSWLFPLSDRRLISWLLKLLKLRDDQPAAAEDVRYLLAKALIHPHVQAAFDLVIIDAPPRLTTSHIQAMCASTHLLIPTILDGLSADAVGRYLDQVATHKLGPVGNASRAICPHLEPIGVVCTMIHPNLQNFDGLINVLNARIAGGRLQPAILPQDCFIRQRPPYREHAGERIAYAALANNADHVALREEVDRLGNWIAPKLAAEARTWRRRDAGAN
jgi:chromosome partitioning protein